MIKINRKFEYALMILQVFGQYQTSHQISAKNLSKSLHIPIDTTSKVMQLLARQNILESAQGVRGGYSLVKKLDQINLYELSTAIQGEFTDLNCHSGTCSIQDHCQIIHPVNNFTNKLKDFFIQTNVEEVLRA